MSQAPPIPGAGIFPIHSQPGLSPGGCTILFVVVRVREVHVKEGKLMAVIQTN